MATEHADANERKLSARPADAPPASVVVHLYRNDDVCDALDALAAFVDGREPFSRSVYLDRVRGDARLLPSGTEPARTAQFNDETVALAHGPGWTLHVTRWSDRSARVTATGIDRHVVDTVLAEAIEGAVEAAPKGEPTVEIGFWFLTRCGDATRKARCVAVADWPDVRRNYGKRVGAALSRLMAIDPSTLSGRLLLLHGPPGTGKTSALRSLAYAWKDWCDVDYVTDPESLLKEPGYLMGVATGRNTDDRDKWRLLLLEDCDELIRADAKPNAGQSLARLLNLTDGLLGQGLKLLVAITTNEPLASLHPAVVRPGRCIAQIEVGRLTPTEARAWLGRPAAVGPDGATLAELYALQGHLTTVEEVAPAAVGGGLYL